MSLKALAQERLAVIRGNETPPETSVKQTKQEGSESDALFHDGRPCFTAMKHGEPQKTAENGPCFTVSSPRERNGETSPVPPEIVAGLATLQRVARPRITRPEVWPEIVADALRLVDEGWAAKALALGWAPPDLFGCSPTKGGNPDHDGLAVALAGRRIVLLHERAAIIESEAGTHSLFNLRPRPGAVLLWELGVRR